MANLLAHPEATLRIGNRDAPVTARLVDAEDRARLWPRITAVWPAYDSYVERVSRDIRVFRLTPR